MLSTNKISCSTSKRFFLEQHLFLCSSVRQILDDIEDNSLQGLGYGRRKTNRLVAGNICHISFLENWLILYKLPSAWKCPSVNLFHLQHNLLLFILSWFRVGSFFLDQANCFSFAYRAVRKFYLKKLERWNIFLTIHEPIRRPSI